MKHLVILGKYYPPELGGVERYTRDIAHAASKAFRVTVVVHNRERHDSIEQDGDVSVVRCGISAVIKSQPISPSMLRRLSRLQPDIIHFNAPNFWAAAMLLLARHKAPLIITHHADVFARPLLKRTVIPIYRRLVHQSTCVVVNSKKNAVASSDLPKDVRSIVEIPWGVDAKRYGGHQANDTEIRAERQRRFGSAPVVGFVGRFVRYKALPVLIDALSRLNGVHGLLIGDGPLREQIQQQARDAGIADRVHFLGNLDEDGKIRAMRMMDVLAFPSNDTTEAFGVVQVEAQLMGLPVIASRLPTGANDITLDEITGLLVPPNDPEALSGAISRLLNDPAFAQHLGIAGRERALRLFTLDLFDERILNLFDAVLTGQSVGKPMTRTSDDAPRTPSDQPA
jgi:glycosyltransferase involved in cell wall biosynthesis